MLSLHSSVRYSYLQPWECDEVSLPLSSHVELAGGSQTWKEECWGLKLHSGVNPES